MQTENTTFEGINITAIITAPHAMSSAEGRSEMDLLRNAIANAEWGTMLAILNTFSNPTTAQIAALERGHVVTWQRRIAAVTSAVNQRVVSMQHEYRNDVPERDRRYEQARQSIRQFTWLTDQLDQMGRTPSRYRRQHVL